MATTTLTMKDGRGNYELVAAAGDHIGRTIQVTGRPYEHRLLSILTAALRPGDLAVDVGANIGNHTVALARHGARVAAIEANPDAVKLLDRNVKANGLGHLVAVHRVGLSDRAGRGVARVRIEGNLGSATVDRDDDGPIQLVTFDQLGITDTVRLVKVDVEGAELAVLRGSVAMLQRDRPMLIVELQTSLARRQARALLRPLGYRLLPVSLSGEPTFLLWARAGDLAAVLRHPNFTRQMAQRTASRIRHMRG